MKRRTVVAETRSDPWSLGIPGVIDPAPAIRSPLDDARGEAWDQAGQPIGCSNDGAPVFSTGTVTPDRGR